MDKQTLMGQRLVFGFRGTAITDEFASLLREYKVGSVILFRDNIADAARLRILCRDIQSLVKNATGFPAFIMIDQEGGMVSRLSPDLVCVPGNMAAAATGDPDTAYRMAQITARQLRGTGPNFVLAPVLDVNNNSANPVIGVRSYGDDPACTAEFGKAAVRGYLDSGLICCGKHFPGHGDTAVDSHIGLPLIDKSLDEIEKTELVPFRAAIEAGLPAIMSSHILYPRIEPAGVPATMSRRIMHDLLRDEMKFEGLVLSDAIEMDAIRIHYGAAHGTAEAMKAGVDLVFICSDPVLQRECAEAVRKAVESGEISDGNLEESFNRITAAKEKYAFTEIDPLLAGRPEDFAEVRQVMRTAASLYSGKFETLREDTFFCGPDDYRMTNAANSKDYSSHFVKCMQQNFGSAGMACSVDPDRNEIAEITAEAAGHQNIVLGVCNGHIYRGQIMLAEALIKTGLPMTVIALRNPYDLAMIPDGPAKLAVYDYTSEGLDAAAEFLRHGTAPGKIPVRL